MDSPVTYIVSGFMRSGTSMMMAALEAGGLSAVRSDERDQMNDKFGDEHYKPNPGGFYEIPFQQIRGVDFPKQHEGRLLKILYAHITRIRVMRYKVVFMLRDPEEIRQSYEAAFGRSLPMQGHVELMDHVISLIKNRRDMEVTVLRYRDVVEDPKSAFQQLAEAGWQIDPEKAAGIVDPALCRFKLEDLTPGI